MDDPQANSSVTHAEIAALGSGLVEQAEGIGLHLRLVGGVGVWSSLPSELRDGYERHRPAPRDIDVLAPPRAGSAVKELFTRGEHLPDERLNAWRGDQRQRWFVSAGVGGGRVEVDVFIGRPPQCHEIDLTGRFDVPPPAMRPTDLLLQKLQIVEINEKDLTDAAYLLLSASRSAGDGLESGRVVEHLSGDWGFYHTASTNLGKVRAFAAGILAPDEAAAVTETASHLMAGADAAPKSMRWKIRAKVGTRAVWYEEVEEVER